VQAQPLAQCHLLARHLGQYGAFERAGHGYAVFLPPPTAGTGVFKHGIEVIHAYQPELLALAFRFRNKNASAAAYCAICYHNGLARNYIAHLMVVADVLNRVGARLSLVYDTDDQSVGIYFVVGSRFHQYLFRLVKHVVGRHFKVDIIGQRNQHHHCQRRRPIEFKLGFEIGKKNEKRKNASENPAFGI